MMSVLPQTVEKYANSGPKFEKYTVLLYSVSVTCNSIHNTYTKPTQLVSYNVHPYWLLKTTNSKISLHDNLPYKKGRLSSKIKGYFLIFWIISGEHRVYIVHTHTDFINRLQKLNVHHGAPSNSPVTNSHEWQTN